MILCFPKVPTSVITIEAAELILPYIYLKALSTKALFYSPRDTQSCNTKMKFYFTLKIL